MNYEQNTKKQGKVWLVGAGPSDQELLTVKGKRLLSEADVIVYDRLAGQGVLTYGAEHAEYIDVGKHSGNHRVRQSEINQILVKGCPFKRRRSVCVWARRGGGGRTKEGGNSV